MSGPGLAQHAAHHAIHEAAYLEAEDFTGLLRHAAGDGATDEALRLTAILLEHWHTRTLAHATAEEQGWYRAVTEAHPERRDDVIQLTRDHDLMRRLVDDIEQLVSARGWNIGILARFETLLLLQSIHSQDEEARLLGTIRPNAGAAVLASVRHEGAPAELGAGVAAVAEMPLAVANPALYHHVSDILERHSVHPGDVSMTAVPNDSRDAHGIRLRIAYGAHLRTTSLVELPDPGDDAAVDRAFSRVAAQCLEALRTGAEDDSAPPEDQSLRPDKAHGSPAKRQITLPVIQSPGSTA